MIGRLALGWALGTLASIAWDSIPFTHADTQGWKVTRYQTIITQGVNVRGRIGGRLYALDVWREDDRGR